MLSAAPLAPLKSGKGCERERAHNTQVEQTHYASKFKCFCFAAVTISIAICTFLASLLHIVSSYLADIVSLRSGPRAYLRFFCLSQYYNPKCVGFLYPNVFSLLAYSLGFHLIFVAHTLVTWFW